MMVPIWDIESNNITFELSVFLKLVFFNDLWEMKLVQYAAFSHGGIC